MQFEKLISYYRFAFIYLIADFKPKKIGILWQPLSSILFIFSVGLVFANIQKSDPFGHLIYVAIGYTAWTYIASVITSGSNLYTINKSKILTGAYTSEDCLVIMHARMTIQFFINHLSIITTLSFVFLISEKSEISTSLLFLPVTFLILSIVSYNAQSLVSLICLRFPDSQELISSVLRIAFLATPIMWERQYKTDFEVFDLNIFYHFIEIYRFCFSSSPFPSKSFFIVVLFSAVLIVIGSVSRRLYLPVVSRSL